MSILRVSRAKNWIKFLLLFACFIGLSCCNTSNQVASSFGKRKYTKGFFNDPFAKINSPFRKSDSRATVNKSVNPATIATFSNPPAVPIHSTSSGQIYNKSSYSSAGSSVITKSQSNLRQTNTVIKESATCPAGTPDNDRRDEEEIRKAHTYLIVWLSCLGLALLCFIVAIQFTLTNPAGGCVMLVITMAALITSVVFCIMWIVAITDW